MDIDKLIERLRENRDHWKRLEHELSECVNDKDAEHERLQAENEKLRAELEQVKREKDKLERFLGELEGAIYTGQYFHLRPMIEKWRGQKED